MTALDLVALLDPLLGRLADLVAAKLQNGTGDGHHPPEAPDTLLDAKQAALRLSVTVRWLYAHASTLPFTVHLPGSRAVRFSERGISRWLAKRQGQ